MIARWVPDRLMRRALYGIVVWMLCIATVAGFLTAAEAEEKWPGRQLEPLLQSMVLNGVSTPETADIVQRLGKQVEPGTLVAVLDPVTRKAITAYPESLVGKKPEEMTLADGRLLPLPASGLFNTYGSSPDGEKTQVWITPVFPPEMYQSAFDGIKFRSRDFPEFQFRYPSVYRIPLQSDRTARPEPVDPPQVLKAWLLVATPSPYLQLFGTVAVGFAVLAGLGLLTYWLSLAWWVYTDARERRQNALVWGLVALVTNLPGLLAYLLYRRAGRNCPGCGAATNESFVFCSGCGRQLKHTCVRCGHDLPEKWAYCVQCGSPHSPAQGQ